LVETLLSTEYVKNKKVTINQIDMTTFYYVVKIILYTIIIGIKKYRTRLVVKLNG